MALGGGDPKLESTAKALVLISLLFGLLAFTSPTGENVRRSGIDLNPVLHAKLLFFPALMVLAQRIKFADRPMLILISIFCAVACIKTGSRGPLAVFFALFLFDRLLTLRVQQAMRALGAVFVMAVLFIAVIQLLPPELSSRFTLVSLMSQNHEGDRLFLINLALELISLHPNGIGMGNMSGFFWLNAPHNIVLEAVLDFGLLFALPYLIVLFMAAGRAVVFLKSSDNSQRFLGGWFLFYFGNSLMGGEMSFPSMLLYIPMGLLLLAPRSLKTPGAKPIYPQRITP